MVLGFDASIFTDQALEAFSALLCQCHSDIEQVLREENTLDSFPVITIADADRFLADRVYRNRCVDRILEILLDIETWMGVGRLFVP
ncbi:hypothetical protein [Nodosilinea nodulosa]|uniref:hypothetical protein n=1 Tax=Nodosilinea nodulosa TaxID=416001 RepID=UPI0009FF74EA|nr:hypothetical protein [Nodosilinea nodulosa]